MHQLPYISIATLFTAIMLTGVIDKTVFTLLQLNNYISNIYILVQNSRLTSQNICDHMFPDTDYILHSSVAYLDYPLVLEPRYTGVTAT